MKEGETLYVPHADDVDIVTFVEEGTGGKNFRIKPRESDYIVVRDQKTGEQYTVRRDTVYTNPLAASIASAEMDRRLSMGD